MGYGNAQDRSLGGNVAEPDTLAGVSWARPAPQGRAVWLGPSRPPASSRGLVGAAPGTAGCPRPGVGGGS